MSFSMTGDSLIMKHLPANYDGFQEVADFIGQAEARITNLETTLTRGNRYGSAFSGGTWLTVEPEILDDLATFGFNIYGCANNHTLDYSYLGLMDTLKFLREANVVFAGIGENLHEASRAAAAELPSARVGLISLCSCFEPSARAGAQTPYMPGRPGLNPLRFKTQYTVTPEHFKALGEIGEATGINLISSFEQKQGFAPMDPPGTMRFGKDIFVQGEKEGRFTIPNQNDVERTVKGIQDALRTMDYVAVMIHSHEMKWDKPCQADYFMEDFAHKCIDAGACAVIGGGTHQLKGIEIWHGKPIFYSLGNFIFQNEYVKVLPADYMEKHSFPLDYTASQGIAGRSALAKPGFCMHENIWNFLSVIPYFELDGDKCSDISLLPIGLGLDRCTYLRNLPHPASLDDARKIYDYLCDASKPYGTKLTLGEDGKITVAV